MYRKRILAFMLCICLTIGLIHSSSVTSAKKTVKLSAKTINVNVGKTKTLKIKNTKKTVKWSVVSGMTNIVMVKKGKYTVSVTGRIVGSSIIQAKVGKKKYECMINIASKIRAATFTEASWSSKRPLNGDEVSGPTNYPSSPGAGKNNNSGINDIFYYDLDYTDDSGNLITTAVSTSTTQAKKKTPSTASDGSTIDDGYDDVEDVDYEFDFDYDYDYDMPEEDDEDAVISNTDGKNADDVAALVNLIELQEYYGRYVPKNLDSEIYNWEELVPGSGVERLVGVNLSGLGIMGDLSFDDYISDTRLYGTVDKTKPAFSQLTDINVSDNQLSSVKCDKCNLLEKLSIGNNAMTSFSISGKNSLVDFSCADTEMLQSLRIANCKSLEDVNFAECPYLTSLDFTGDSAIGEVNCADGMLTTLILEGCTSLYFLNCSSNKLTGLKLQSCTALEEVNCSNNNLSSIAVNIPSLVILDCSENSLSGLNLQACANLATLDCSDNRLTRLDLKVAKDLAEIDYTGNSSLRFTGSSPTVLLYVGLDMDSLTILGDDIAEPDDAE